jgi:hypothetical protein
MYLTFMMIGDRWAARHNISRPKPVPATTRLLPPPAARREAGK